MDPSKHHSPARSVWKLARRQHGVVGHGQLRGLGFSGDAIRHRVERGRLHRIDVGVYAVGRRELSRHGRWMAAVLACGSRAALSHRSAAAMWGFGREREGEIEVSVPYTSPHRRPGITVHRRPKLREEDVTVRNGIPVTAPVRTLIDLAWKLDGKRLERAINEADRLDLVDPEALYLALDGYPGQRGVGVLREMLGHWFFRLTDSELERRFLRLAEEAGLGPPETGTLVNGFKVDFCWPRLRLVVETDGLRYHRTPAQQGRDRLRDQAHTAAGMAHLRFTHAQVRFEPAHVLATLMATAAGLGAVPQSAARQRREWRMET